MKILIDALSTTNLSGKYVLHGYLRALTTAHGDACRFTVLHHRGNADLRCELGGAVQWRECPSLTGHWLARAIWERTVLPGMLRGLKADVLMTASGMVLGGCPVPQWTLAMNPWCLVPGVPQGVEGRVKAVLQRRAYRQAVRRADAIIFLSDYLRDAYRRDAGCVEKRGVVAYAGLAEDVCAALGHPAPPFAARANEIVTVSAMAPHKGVETVVRALVRLCRDGGEPPLLRLVGAWPDAGYEAQIRQLVGSLGVEERVMFEGHLPRQQLLERYSRARVICLMSRCESFGIPTVEAQAFGVPVVGSNCCATPEVCGEGGLYFDDADADGVAGSLRVMLSDEAAWGRLSAAARRNAQRFVPDEACRPLVEMMHEYVAGCR